MPTPMTYNHTQLKEILDGSQDSKLFHHTDIANLKSILDAGGIYSIGTLWGLYPDRREKFKGNNPEVSAQLGFVDYVFITPVNYLATEGAKPIYGRIAFEVDLSVLVDRDFFVYPFNTGKVWDEPWADGKKKSDLTTLEFVLRDKAIHHEILIRRKIDASYINKVICFDSDKDEVSQVIASSGKHKTVESTPDKDNNGLHSVESKVTLMKKQKIPDFSIEIKTRRGGTENVGPDRLFYNPNVSGNVCFFDAQTGCISEYRIESDFVYSLYGGYKVGKVRKEDQVDVAISI